MGDKIPLQGVVQGIALRARDVIRQVYMSREIKILKGHVSRDHMHLLVSSPPGLSVSQMMQYIKGKSSYVLQQEFPELKRRYWGQHLWARGYFCASSGTVTDAMIKAYIEQQDIPPQDGFTVTDEKL
jgi:putative transposase